MASETGGTGRMSRFMRVLGLVLAGIVVAAMVSSDVEAKMTLKDKVGENELKLEIYGFSQLEARGGDGWRIARSRPEGSDGVDFNAQRVRIGFNYFHSGPIAGKLFLDLNQSYTLNEGGLPNLIKDGFVAYKFNNAAFARLGMIKTPLGMAFTVPGWNMDNVERNELDKGLVLERNFGFMVSGRLIGQGGIFADKKQMSVNGLEMGTERQGYGFGYDIGIFNPAGRSSAVTWSAPKEQEGHCSITTATTCDESGDCPGGEACIMTTTTHQGGNVRGDALAYVGRLHFDYGPQLHAEVSYGVSEQAGGFIDKESTKDKVEESEDYKVFDFGVASEFDLWDQFFELKLEYINGTGIRGIEFDGEMLEQSCWVATVGWLFMPWAQFMVKTYQAKFEAPPDYLIKQAEELDLDPNNHGLEEESDLGNTYIGFNFYPKRVSDKHRDLQRHKISVNYVFVNGDDGKVVDAAPGAPSTKELDGCRWLSPLGGYIDDTWTVQWQYKF